MKRVLSHLVLLAVVTTACGDSFNPSSVAGVYERADVPVILSSGRIVTESGFREEELRVDWEHYTLTAASNWTVEASLRVVVEVFDFGGMLVDSFDIPQSSPVTSGSFTLSPPDSIFFSDGSQTFGGTIVPPNLGVGVITYTRQ